MPKQKDARAYAETSPTPIQLLLPTGAWVEGSVYVSGEPNRFSDAWDQVFRDARGFVAIRGAETRNPDGSLGDKDPVLLVRKDSIVAIKPLEDD